MGGKVERGPLFIRLRGSWRVDAVDGHVLVTFSLFIASKQDLQPLRGPDGVRGGHRDRDLEFDRHSGALPVRDVSTGDDVDCIERSHVPKLPSAMTSFADLGMLLIFTKGSIPLASADETLHERSFKEG